MELDQEQRAIFVSYKSKVCLLLFCYDKGEPLDNCERVGGGGGGGCEKRSTQSKKILGWKEKENAKVGFQKWWQCFDISKVELDDSSALFKGKAGRATGNCNLMRSHLSWNSCAKTFMHLFHFLSTENNFFVTCHLFSMQRQFQTDVVVWLAIII